MNHEDWKKERERLIDHLGSDEVLTKLIEYLSNRVSFWRLIKKIKHWWN